MLVRIKKNKISVLTISVMLILIVILTMAIEIPTSINNLMRFTIDLPVFTGTVPTPSMFPTISQGDIILVDTRIALDDVMLYDIVVFDAPVGMVVHRVIGFEDGNLITKGDYNSDSDELRVTESTYIGSIMYVFNGGSYWAVLILGCILGWFACDTWQKRKHKRNMEGE